MTRCSRGQVKTVNGKALPPPVIEGEKAPDFSGVDLNGVKRTLSENRGYVTLVQFWATWCPHCRHDVPMVKQLYDTDRERGLRVLALSVDSNRRQLEQFVSNNQISYPVIPLLGDDTIPDRYESQGVPSYFLVDKSGTIAGP